jgi:glycosyltransferase involved in cell wall biosynthesis
MTRRLRVGYVIGALAAAGSERQMLALAERLPRDRFEPEFVLLARPGENAGRATAAGIAVHVVPPVRMGESNSVAAGARAARKAANFVRLVRRRRYDIVDAWLFQAYLLAVATRRLTHVPIVVTGRRSLASAEPNGRPARLLKRLAAAGSDAVIANSPQVAASQPRSSRLRVIMNGVVLPPPVQPAGVAALRAELGIPRDALVVATVATLNPGKGHDLVLEAVATLVPRHETAYVVFIGDGELRPHLEARSRELGMADRLLITGLVLDAARLLPAIDVLVHASQSEGLPNAVLEAAAAGRAIVASDVGGTPEIVADGLSGLLVPPDDRASLVVAIERVLGDADLRARLGAAAREHATTRFAMDRFVAEYAELYLGLAARRGLI